MKKTKEKIKKEKTSRKKKLVENKGITGAGTDYTVYILTFPQKMFAVLCGFVIGFGASYIYYENMILAVIVGLAAAYKAISIYRNMKQDKRSKALRLQFRDMLESLSSAYTVGMTEKRAFEAAYESMKLEHGENSYIAQELELICNAYNRNLEIRTMLNDFAQRSGLDDVQSFASVFYVSAELGGNIAKVIRETRDIIGDKIETELEIQTMVAGQKNQLNILAVMPLVMSVFTKTFGSAGGALAITVKTVALLMFVFAYWLGTRIVDIKV